MAVTDHLLLQLLNECLVLYPINRVNKEIRKKEMRTYH
jgi:hypothetical protein